MCTVYRHCTVHSTPYAGVILTHFVDCEGHIRSDNLVPADVGSGFGVGGFESENAIIEGSLSHGYDVVVPLKVLLSSDVGQGEFGVYRRGGFPGGYRRGLHALQ